MKWIVMIAMCTYMPVRAQLFEEFSDGDFSGNPVWTGDTTEFVVNSSGQLQSNSTVADHRFYLSTANSIIAAHWSFRLKLELSTSSLNYVDVYLTSAYQNLIQDGNTGYFVRIGNTQDEISLYRKEVTGEVKIIDGVDGSVSGSGNEVVVTVSRSPVGRFVLMRDIGPNGNLFAEGSVTDTNFSHSNFFGFAVKQGSSSFFQRHFFDNIYISDFQPDTLPPGIHSITAITSSTADVEFSESVDPSTALSPLNYVVDNNVGLASGVTADPLNPRLYHLTFFNSFPEREQLHLSVSGISDLSGNVIQGGGGTFAFFHPSFGDVLIAEIMADPAPSQGLPEVEWVELKNNSGFSLSLQGWKFCRSGSCLTLPPFILGKDSMVVLSSQSASRELMQFANVLGLASFPSLSNEKDEISLYSPSGNVIHALEYSNEWYGDEFKKLGGFSLELIDASVPCVGFGNWRGSNAASGGTPGKVNSLHEPATDVPTIEALRIIILDSMHILLVMNSMIDSLSAAAASYSLSPRGIDILSANALTPLFNGVQLQLNAPLERNVIYELTVSGIRNCTGSTLSSAIIPFGLPEHPGAGDILINEVLFNPFPGNVDFVELYNCSNKVFALNELFIANRNESGDLNSIVRISEAPVLFLPGEFIVITESYSKLRSQYVCGDEKRFIPLFTPSMPDDEGDVIILDGAGVVLDEVNYTDDWHFPLITNAEGISLERVSFSPASSVATNWHSAASSHGYATPALQNSQSRVNISPPAHIDVQPKVVSPNRDGRDDFACIYYGLTVNGYTANLTIFDASGQRVRYLCRNELCGINGFWKWDGLGDEEQTLPAGVYIIFIELLNPNGDKLAFKKPVVLAGEAF